GARTTDKPGTNVTLTLRPEMLQLYSDAARAANGRNSLEGSIARRVFFGDSMIYEVDIGAAGTMDVRIENVPSARRWEVGDSIFVDFHREAAIALSDD
ncbi:MAG: TOBE domain-containing protein, partial [Acidimicrobiia bacterium]